MKANTANMAKILREEDIPYVSAVVDYLRSKELEVEFRGSVLSGNKEYKDIDLIAMGDPGAVTAATSGFMGFSPKPFPRKTEEGLEFKVTYIGGPTTYVNSRVNDRFKIYGGETTEIDVNLKVRY